MLGTAVRHQAFFVIPGTDSKLPDLTGKFLYHFSVLSVIMRSGSKSVKRGERYETNRPYFSKLDFAEK